MFSFKMFPTTEFDEIISYLNSKNVEVNCEKDNLVKAWKLTQGDDYILGAIMISKIGDKYFIEGLAIDNIMRKFGLGKVLINKAKSDVKQRGCDALYVKTNDYGYFLKRGFEIIEDCSENDIKLLKIQL